MFSESSSETTSEKQSGMRPKKHLTSTCIGTILDNWSYTFIRNAFLPACPVLHPKQFLTWSLLEWLLLHAER